MFAGMFALALAAAPPAKVALMRQAIARHALAELRHFDPRWNPAQRDCAGFVRYVYRRAFADLDPARLKRPLWRDARGRPTDFADARNLLAGNFTLLGRGAAAQARLRTGDLVAFRRGPEGAEIFHLMLVLRDGDPAHGVYVIYDPGLPKTALRGGSLRELDHNAPGEWRPVPQNANFLGFYRFKEWAHGPHQ